MKTQPAQTISCRELTTFDTTDLDSIRKAFLNSEECLLQQTWLPEPETDFMPAVARVGWLGDLLLVFTELMDQHIFTQATDHNQRFWELGDTFEIFLRPSTQTSYVELHITPNNLKLQLRFADTDAVKSIRQGGSFDNLLISDNPFRSKTWVQPERNCWYVLAEIPAEAVAEKLTPLPGSKWMFSLCRYDYIRGRKSPVISSTSAYSQPDFHCQDQWGELVFI